MKEGKVKAGKIAVLSKSGTLLYEISDALTNAGFGQSITIGIGGDPVNGTRLIDAFEMVKDISDLEGLVIVGEIGGDSEEMLAQKIIDSGFNKPAVAYIAGRAAPKEKRMGHAGAIVSAYGESAVEKVEAIRGVTFDWKDGSGSTAGIIAQEVEAILPSIVVQGEYKAVDYNGLIGLLVEAVKELSAEVKELKANN